MPEADQPPPAAAVAPAAEEGDLTAAADTLDALAGLADRATYVAPTHDCVRTPSHTNHSDELATAAEAEPAPRADAPRWDSKSDMPQKWVQCSQCEQWRRVREAGVRAAMPLHTATLRRCHTT